MPNYQYDVNINRQKKFIRWFKKILWLCLVMVAIGGSIVLIDTFRQDKYSDVKTSQPTITTVGPSIREFETPYFSFTAPTSWTNILAESTQSKFVYRSLRGALIENELTIYANDPSSYLSATYVLPVRIQDGKHIIPTEVSEHCSKASEVKKASIPVKVNIMNTTMLCNLDSTSYLVIVGEKGGNTEIKLKRSNGSEISYRFLYRSSTVPADSLPLANIMNNFTPL
jgi:hypothetical protein